MELELQCRGSCFAINFNNLPSPGSVGGNFSYSLSASHMRLSPKRRFVNDVEINHQKGESCSSSLHCLPFNHTHLCSPIQMMTIIYGLVS